jgi:hypothetical protein
MVLIHIEACASFCSGRIYSSLLIALVHTLSLKFWSSFSTHFIYLYYRLKLLEKKKNYSNLLLKRRA